MKFKSFIITCFLFISMFALWGGTSTKEQQIMLNEKNNTIQLGIKNQYYFEFKRINNQWNFNGVFAGSKNDLLFDSMGTSFYRFLPLQYNQQNPDTIFNHTIDNVFILKNTNDEKQIEIKNAQASMVLTVKQGSPYIERYFTIENKVDNYLSDFQMSFTLRTNPELIVREFGAIATKDPSEIHSDLPYAFPALYTKLFSENISYNVVNVVDYQNTNQAFGKMRKRKVVDQYELGVASKNNNLKSNTYTFKDYWSIDTEKVSYYELIGRAAEQYLKINPLPVEDLASKANVIASSFEVIVNGLYQDLIDPRAGVNKLQGAMKPYAYQEDHGGWGESFVLLDTTKGMLRYALTLNDATKTEFVMQLIKRLTSTQTSGPNWIEPYTGNNAKSNEYFLHHTYADGVFINNSSGEETGSRTGISGWKYYDMLANLADLAQITLDESIVGGFLKLMPFLNTLKLEGYVQPVAWYYDTRLPATGYEDGGSAGNASTWAYIHLMASMLSKTQGDYYKQEGLNSLDYANSLDYFNMTAMRTAVKPVVIGWNVRANLLAYKLTGQSKYLEKAKTVAKGLLSFYYINSNPQTFFATIGFGYADLKERWEAYLEMAQSIWLVAPVLQYMNDYKPLMDLLYAASKTYMYAFPINGNPYGNYQRVPGYDSLDAFYIPFEFSTGVLGDNPGNEGGTQAMYRQVKEIYGSGEAFLNYLMFEAYGKALNQHVLMLCLTGAYNTFKQDSHIFVLYNPSQDKQNTTLQFNYMQDGNYKVSMNGTSIGTFSYTALKQGIVVNVAAYESIQIEIKKV